LHENIRLGRKRLAVADTLDCSNGVVIVIVKCFIGQTPEEILEQAKRNWILESNQELFWLQIFKYYLLNEIFPTR